MPKSSNSSRVQGLDSQGRVSAVLMPILLIPERLSGSISVPFLHKWAVQNGSSIAGPRPLISSDLSLGQEVF